MDEMKIALLKNRGIDINEMQSEEWLELALQSEQFAKDVGPFDFTYAKFKNDAKLFFEAACLKELH